MSCVSRVPSALSETISRLLISCFFFHRPSARASPREKNYLCLVRVLEKRSCFLLIQTSLVNPAVRIFEPVPSPIRNIRNHKFGQACPVQGPLFRDPSGGGYSWKGFKKNY